MSLYYFDFLEEVKQHEAGVADLIAAYEIAEQPYFEATRHSTPLPAEIVASDTTFCD